MKCYTCDQAGESKEAVGICVVCGMGVCSHHAVRKDVPVWLWQGLLPPKGPMPKSMMRIQCDTCAQALVQEGVEV